MSLVFFDGCQDAGVMPKPEYTLNFSSTTGRDGSTNGAAVVGTGWLNFTLGSSTLLHGFGFRPVGSTFGSSSTMMSWSSGSTPTFLLHMGITTMGFLDFRRGSDFNSGTSLGITSGHIPFADGVWRHIQVKYIAHVSNGTLIVKVDGVTCLSVTGVQTAPSTATPDRWHHNTFNNFGTTWAIDDIWLADGVDATSTQGKANNDLLGDLKVATILPSGAGDTTQWTPSTGANYAAVDEVPPNSTDYVSTHTSGQRDLYAVQDLPSLASIVYGLRIGIYGKKSDAGGASEVKPVIKESGGTVTAQGALPLTTSDLPHYGPSLYVKPSNGAEFSVADVNGLQVGLELA